MSNVVYYTQEGLQKLKDELHYLETVERKKCTEAVVEAREKGDLSENAEYDAAREAQAMLELRISQLKELISNARILDESQIDTSKVSILTTVKIKNIKSGAQLKYTLVPEKEADLKKGKISVDSPIAKALLGRVCGEKVEVNVPAGLIQLEILEITFEK
jgi:transcription elongation factor GreA